MIARAFSSMVLIFLPCLAAAKDTNATGSSPTPSSGSLYRHLGEPLSAIDLDDWLGAHSPYSSNTTYRQTFRAEHAQCVESLQFRPSSRQDSDSELRLTQIEGRCPDPKKPVCGEILPGLTCVVGMEEAEAMLRSEPSVSDLEAGSNLNNHTLDFTYRTTDGTSVSTQLRFRPNSKNGRPNKKKPWNLVAYRFE